MDLRHFLFSFEGRISRAQWWLFSIPYALFVSLLYLSQSDGFASSAPLKTYAAIVLLIVSTAVTYMWLAVNVKRCHDRGHSGWFVLLSIFPLVNIWYLVEVGFLRGQPGVNKYGPDPKATMVSPTIFGPSTHPQSKAG